MRPALRGIGALFSLSLAIAGCGKPDDDSNRQDVSNRQSVSVSNGQAASDAELMNQAVWNAFGGDGDEVADEDASPATIAARLSAAGAVEIKGDAFTMKGPVTCKPSRPGEDWTIQCMVRVTEEGKGPAEVDVNLYDQDQDYAAAEETLRTKMDRGAKPTSLGMHYTYQVEDPKKPSKSGDFGSYCYQTTSAPRSFAVCLVKARPRALIYAIVSPAAQGELDGADIERAGNLGAQALFAMNHAL